MRTTRTKVAWLAVASAAAMLAACGPTYTNPNKTKREDAAIDVLDCQKAAILKYKASKIDDKSTYEERQAAVAIARVAWDRCLKARGWKKNQ